ncbi:MAG: hypothetical protein CSA55_00770 [Ilumatobacter coccineus]|uniref:Uncharacterized protein n=1 Tax=Ilumatobacter coccineus TaxID=467094 RepID=A0A2G6KFI0_9ACTN|nr:MAG: hypothetical protein CSA55_00770 [Ilumatobacter coccineus]
MIWVVVGLAVLVIAVVVIVVMRSRSGPRDGVESFRRQIDALSREARRPVVDQVRARQTDEGDNDGT